MTQSAPDKARLPTSVVLQDLLGGAPSATLTLGWLFGRLGERSFGIVLLFLALLAMLPGLSTVVGLVLPILAMQMILGRRGPIFPRRVTERRLSAKRMATLINRAVPPLRWLERFVRPRWITPFDATKRFVGVLVLLLGLLLFAPVPLSNVPVALVILLLAVAYLEEDGILLSLSLAAAIVLLGAATFAVWETIRVTGL